MSKLLVTGRKKLDGEVEVQGAKTALCRLLPPRFLQKVKM